MNIGQTTEKLIGDWNMVTKKLIKIFITEFIRLPVAGRNAMIHTIGTIYKIGTHIKLDHSPTHLNECLILPFF